ncbi:Tn3 family transposase [Nocardia sp. NBC_01329]|nr:Tn3 family transposase [Nocardia sp. NBC_01329]
MDCVTHAGGKQTRTPEFERNLIAVLLAHSTNLGLTWMAQACGITFDILSWTANGMCAGRPCARPTSH